MSTMDIRPYWLELMKDALYRKPLVGPQAALFRTVENISMYIPHEAWESMPLSLEDLGYSGSGSKQRQWTSYYWPLDPEWDLFRGKIEAIRDSGGYYASIALPLKGVKAKENIVKGTKGNCLLNLVVNITRVRKEAPTYKVWLIGRYTEIVKKFGADLYFVHGLLLPKVRSIIEDVLPDAQFRGVELYFTAAYLVFYKVMALALVTDAPDAVLREAVEHTRQSSNPGDTIFLRASIGSIIESIEGTVTRFKYKEYVRLGLLYGPLWIPYADAVREIWEEVKQWR